MKTLICVCLLAMSAGAIAQAPTPAEAGRREAAAAKRDAESAKRDADEAATRAKLDEARARLDKAAREVAELSTQLGADARRHSFTFIHGDRRAMLGVQIDPDSGRDGARIRSVSPGGPAAEAGLRDGDVIVALDGKSIAGAENAGRAVVEQMRGVKPDQKVKVRVLRAGKNQDLVIIARPFAMSEDRMFNFAVPAVGAMSAIEGMPMVQRFGAWPGEFGGMELTSMTPKLGAYFGASEGVLVVQAPDNGAFKLEDGDVIQSIDGRKPEDGAHALRILRSYQSGEKLNLGVLRQRKPLTLAITMPERPEHRQGRFMGVEPPMPPPPPMPPAPGVPGTEQ